MSDVKLLFEHIAEIDHLRARVAELELEREGQMNTLKLTADASDDLRSRLEAALEMEREDLKAMQEIQAGLEQYLLKRPREPQITLAEISSYERTLRMRLAKRLAGREKP